eukprot:6366707-Prymnesium_polylepis.1
MKRPSDDRWRMAIACQSRATACESRATARQSRATARQSRPAAGAVTPRLRGAALGGTAALRPRGDRVARGAAGVDRQAAR